MCSRLRWPLRWASGTALAVCASVALGLPSVVAEETNPPPASDGYLLPDYAATTSLLAPDTPWLGLSVDLFLKLALILGLMYGCLWLLRRLSVGTSGPLVKLRAITVLEQTHLAQNRTLYLVELGDRVLLLGATAQQLTTLTEVREPSEVAALRANFQRPAGESFGAQVRAITEHIGRIRKEPAPSSGAVPNASLPNALLTEEGSSARAGSGEPTPEVAPTEAEAAFLREKVAELRRISQHFGR